MHSSCLKSPTLKNDADASGALVPCYVKSLKNNAGASEEVLVAKRKCCLRRRLATAPMHRLYRFHYNVGDDDDDFIIK